MSIAGSHGFAKMRRQTPTTNTLMYFQFTSSLSIQIQKWFRTQVTDVLKITTTMKNLVTIFLMGMVVLFAVSCDEGEVSKKHVYTEEELKLKDSLEAARNNVKANFLF